MIDREAAEKENRRLKIRLERAKFDKSACIEDLDSEVRSGLVASMLVALITCEWIASHLNVAGTTNVGKSYLACALGQKVCREGCSVEYHCVPRLFPELSLAKDDGRYGTIMRLLAKTDLLIFDYWGLFPRRDEAQRDLLELLENRSGKRSTLITSQLPVEKWHEFFDDTTLADANVDRIVHDAYKIHLKGESMRKRKSKINSRKKGEIKKNGKNERKSDPVYDIQYLITYLGIMKIQMPLISSQVLVTTCRYDIGRSIIADSGK